MCFRRGVVCVLGEVLWKNREEGLCHYLPEVTHLVTKLVFSDSMAYLPLPFFFFFEKIFLFILERREKGSQTDSPTKCGP